MSSSRCVIVAAIMVLVLPLPVVASVSLVNGSFEDGTLNGWTVLGNIGDYDPVPLTQCPCGHGLTAADGQYFGGRVRLTAVPPDPTGNPALFRQAVDVANWDVNADRTDFDFELWAQIGFTGSWTDWAATQTYSIWWNNDGTMPHDVATATISGTIVNGDTIEIDTGGVNRVYEFDTDSLLRAPTNVAVNVATGAIAANVSISGTIADGDTIEIDTAGVNRVYEFDIGNGIGPTSSVAVNVGTGAITATVTINGTTADGDTIEVDTGGITATRVYELDNNSTLRDPNNVRVDCTAGFGWSNVRTQLIAAITNDALAPCTAAAGANYITTLTWKGGIEGDAAVNSNLNDKNNRIAVTSFAYAGRTAANARTALIAAINGDGSAPCTAASASGNNLTLTWSGGGEGDTAINSNLNDLNNKIGIGNFAYAGRAAAAAKAALIAAINADADNTPCSASDYGGNNILLTWDTASSSGATNTNLNDANDKIAITDFLSGLTKASFDRQFKITYISSMAFSKGTTNSFDNWRKIKLSGSIPANPQVVVLEISLKSAATTVHNAIDGVVFSAESATGSSIGPFAGDLANSDFEIEPYNTIHCGTEYPNAPSGWDLMKAFRFHAASPSIDDGGPIEGYTNAGTEPPPLPHATDPRGISTTSGTHFWGRAKPVSSDPQVLGGHDLKGWWGKVLAVQNWDSCAIGIRWKVHYLTKMWDSNDSGFQTLEFCWDAPGAANSIVTAPPDPMNAQKLSDQWFPWVRIVDMNDRSTPRSSEFSGLEEIEQIGEFAPTDIDGRAYAPQHVLLRHFTYVYSGGDHSALFKWLYDKVDVYVEAIPGPRPAIHTLSPLPAGTCGQAYSKQLLGCGLGSTSFALAAGKLPNGLTMDAAGLISGTPVTDGTAEFTVQITDDYDSATATKQFQLTVSGTNCCNDPPADFDGDSDVDQVDFALFQICITGAEGGVPTDCECADLDFDGLGIGLQDREVFELCAGGPGMPVAPTCP